MRRRLLITKIRLFCSNNIQKTTVEWFECEEMFLILLFLCIQYEYCMKNPKVYHHIRKVATTVFS